MATDSDSESVMNLQGPDLILLFTWTGAQPHHIAKYTSGYTKLFPSTPIMVVTTSINDLLCRTSAKEQRSLIPALLTILSCRIDSNFLVHCCSGGGAHKAVQFAKVFLQSTGYRLPISALCLDSARGILDHVETAKTCRRSAKLSRVFQILNSLLPHTLAASCWTTYPLIGNSFVETSEYLFTKSHHALNDPTLWKIETPRCYLFSHADKLNNPGSIIEHARSAEKLGARVTVAQFKDTAQCDQVESLANTERYWATVQRTWNASSSTETEKKLICTDFEKRAAIHVSRVHLVDPASEPILSASSSVYSDDDKEVDAAKAAPVPARSYKGPASFCIRKDKGRWYDCLRPVPGYQGWGGMGVDTESFTYDRLTKREPPQNIHQCF